MLGKSPFEVWVSLSLSISEEGIRNFVAVKVRFMRQDTVIE